MTKTLLASAIAVALISTSALAAKSPYVDYVNVSLGAQDVNATSYDSGTALIGTVGKNLHDRAENLSAEVEFSKSISNPGYTNSALSLSAETDVFTVAGYAVYSMPATPELSLRGKAGLLYESVSAEACIAGLCATADNTDFGLSYGVGATWSIKKNLNILGEYTVVESDVSNLSVGMKYNFD